MLQSWIHESAEAQKHECFMFFARWLRFCVSKTNKTAMFNVLWKWFSLSCNSKLKPYNTEGGDTDLLGSCSIFKRFGVHRSLLTWCKCSCSSGDLLVNEGHGSGARGHGSWPFLRTRAPLWLSSLRPPSAERAFDCVRANNVWSSQATERSPLGPLRCERWQGPGSKPIELKEHLSDVFDRNVCSALRLLSV